MDRPLHTIPVDYEAVIKRLADQMYDATRELYEVVGLPTNVSECGFRKLTVVEEPPPKPKCVIPGCTGDRRSKGRKKNDGGKKYMGVCGHHLKERKRLRSAIDRLNSQLQKLLAHHK